MFSYWLTYLFTPIGRFRRRDWHCVWMTSALVNIGTALLYVVLCMNKGWLEIGDDWRLKPTVGMDETFSTAMSAFSLVWGLCTLVAGVMATIKRFHDHGNSGWNSLYLYFPLPIILLAVLFFILSMPKVAGGIICVYLLFVIYLLIKLAFFKGAEHDNHYGMSPYHGEQAPPSVGFVAGLVIFLLLGSAALGAIVIKNYITFYETKKVQAEAAAAAKAVTPEQQAAAAREEQRRTNERMKQDAANGNAEAQYQLSFIFMTGSADTPKNEATGVQWITRAAMQGHLAAQYNLGISYLNGTGVAADYRRAYFWIARAVTNGYQANGTDYRAVAASKLTPADLADLDQRVKTWAPAAERPAPAPAAAK